MNPPATNLEKLNDLLAGARGWNPFYAAKWRAAGLQDHRLAELADLAVFPFTTRDELVADQAAAPPLGTNLSLPPDAFLRFHRSSGTTRAPLLWADSAGSWEAVMRCSQALWRFAGVQPPDRVLFLMPFGASSGPWISFEGACRLGCACFPLGLADPPEQRHWLSCFKPTVLAGKPAALQTLALEAKAGGSPPRDFGVAKLILCGQHDAGLRASLEALWAAECFDRYGLTEAGSVAGECVAHPGGLHLVEDEFIAESVDPLTGAPVPEGEPGELVLTTLGRLARPVIRYRTGDLVRLVRERACACGRRGPMLLGRVTRRTASQPAVLVVPDPGRAGSIDLGQCASSGNGVSFQPNE